ncbi:sensor histidine kinase [Acetobacterium woodii]|uniref:histidine kinase n=1 Tax=Acetobacterium woodii (strain ATCC 29683 / DSM 1030 / JCM 2381 / KCTC 1655 / WB1) TaxID=931626 RepID=H6LF46_ACEWD|nr:ATP-binding protein [Acetobacterium woodii]AFA48146.1 sensory transduction histidine kinase [Acetobacterium woodii DSM 1030]
MFKEIKRKITLFNTLILVIFMFMFIFLLGFLVNWSLNLSGEMYLTNLAKEIIQNNGQTLSQPISSGDSVHEKFGYQFIMWDSSDIVKTMKVDDRNLIMKGYELAINKADKPRFDLLLSENIEYRVYTMPFSNNSNDYILQVFQQVSTERSIITYVISFLFLIGLGSIAVLVPISYFLAGKSLQPIKDTFEDQKKFIANASHELRTPLTVIQTNVEVLKLKEEEQIKDNMKWLNNIASEGETMAKLISELLLLAQAENQQLLIDKEVFDLSSMCQQMVDLMTELANEKGIELSDNISPGIQYRGDEERLKQAVRILVDNAIKYTPEGGKVQLCLIPGKRHLVIDVKDTGIGLTEEEKAKVFSRFYRVDDARNRETGGVGLGLNIADYIVKKHNGKIKIESIPNKGSTFSIVLPKSNQKQDSKK